MALLKDIVKEQESWMLHGLDRLLFTNANDQSLWLTVEKGRAQESWVLFCMKHAVATREYHKRQI
jgi:hypothetical protein